MEITEISNNLVVCTLPDVLRSFVMHDSSFTLKNVRRALATTIGFLDPTVFDTRPWKSLISREIKRELKTWEFPSNAYTEGSTTSTTHSSPPSSKVAPIPTNTLLTASSFLPPSALFAESPNITTYTDSASPSFVAPPSSLPKIDLSLPSTSASQLRVKQESSPLSDTNSSQPSLTTTLSCSSERGPFKQEAMDSEGEEVVRKRPKYSTGRVVRSSSEEAEVEKERTVRKRNRQGRRGRRLTQADRCQEEIITLKRITHSLGYRRLWKDEFAGRETDWPWQIVQLKEALRLCGMRPPYTLAAGQKFKEKRDLTREISALQDYDMKHGANKTTRSRLRVARQPMGPSVVAPTKPKNIQVLHGCRYVMVDEFGNEADVKWQPPPKKRARETL